MTGLTRVLGVRGVPGVPGSPGPPGLACHILYIRSPRFLAAYLFSPLDSSTLAYIRYGDFEARVARCVACCAIQDIVSYRGNKVLRVDSTCFGTVSELFDNK